MNKIYVRTSKSFEFPKRYRAGLLFTKVPNEYDVSNDQLEAIKNDKFLEIIDDKRYEYEISMIKGYENQPSFKAVEDKKAINAVEEPKKKTNKSKK